MNWLGMILGMAAVTYFPRMLPLLLLRQVEPSIRWRRFMRQIPFAALGALVFPGILNSTGPGHWESAVIGGLAALLFAWQDSNLMLVVAAGIGGALFLSGL